MKGEEIVSEPLEIVGLHLGGKSLAQDLWSADNINSSSPLKYYLLSYTTLLHWIQTKGTSALLQFHAEVLLSCKQFTKVVTYNMPRRTSVTLTLLPSNTSVGSK